MARKQIYIASPLGFADSTRTFMSELVALLSEHIDVINPWDDRRFEKDFERLAVENDWTRRTGQLHEISMELGRANTASMDRADGVFAVLDGVDVDSGTAAEIGYAFAKGKYIAGLRTDFRLAGDNDGTIVNLQVEYFVEASGGSIVRTAAQLAEVARAFAID